MNFTRRSLLRGLFSTSALVAAGAIPTIAQEPKLITCEHRGRVYTAVSGTNIIRVRISGGGGGGGGAISTFAPRA